MSRSNVIRIVVTKLIERELAAECPSWFVSSCRIRSTDLVTGVLECVVTKSDLWDADVQEEQTWSVAPVRGVGLLPRRLS